MKNYTIFVRNGVVLHHLTSLFDNTNAVCKLEQDDQIVHCVFCQRLRNPAKLQKILIKFCKSFFMKRFTLTKDPIVIVLL